MSHMVIFQTPDGTPGYNQFDTIDEAVTFVEKLRNEQNVLNSRIFKLEEVKYDFKTYYKVNLQMLNSGAPAAPAAPGAPSAPGAPASPSTPGSSANGEAAAPAAPTGAPVANADSPVGRPSAPPAPGAPAAPSAPGSAPAAAAPAPDPEPARRGLFGR